MSTVVKQLAVFFVALVVIWVKPASAALTHIAGPTPLIASHFVKFDAAFDSVNQVYLVVWGTQFSGPTNGQFVSTAGTPVGPTFAISAPGRWAGWARVIYSAEQGKFLVSYTKILPDLFPPVGGHQRVARFVTYHSPTSRTLSAEIPIDSWRGGPGGEPGMAYSRGRFLVTWWNFNANPPQSYVAVLDSNGNILSTGQLSLFGDGQTDPEIDCDPGRGRCLVVGQAWGIFFDGGRTPGTWAQFIDDQTGAKIGNQFGIYGPIQKEATVTYSPAGDKFLIAFSRTQNTVLAATVDAATMAAGAPYVVRRPFEHPEDAGGYGRPRLAYNPATQTVLLAMKPWIARTAAMELAANGVPKPETFQMTPVAGHWSVGTQEVAPAADPVNNRFLVADNQGFLTMRATIYSGSGSGTPGPPPPPPPTPASQPRMWVDLPSTNATVAGTVVVAGWAIDLGSTSGTGVDAIHVWAHPTSGGAGQILGAATLGISRPDVGTAFGSSRFNSSGYVFTGTLAPGTYDLVVHARSVMTNTFNNSVTVRVNVTAPQSVPRMWVDLPAQNQTLKTAFRVAGWAIDLAAPSGTGVSAVHVWAYPVDGSAPRLVGVATLGHSRPDVGTAFGSARFDTSGFNLNGALEPGVYNLVVFALSSVTGSFNNTSVIRINVVP